MVVLAVPAQGRAQATRTLLDAPADPMQLGVYGGLTTEESRFYGRGVHSKEAESWRVGALIGRWSLGYTQVRLQGGSAVIPATGGADLPILKLRGVEAGRLLLEFGAFQLGSHLTVSEASAERDAYASAGASPIVQKQTTVVVEPALSVGLPIAGLARAELRAGGRLGGRVTFPTPETRIDMTGAYVSATLSVGWFGGWRLGQ